MQLPTLRYGQVGEIRVTVVAPLGLAVGELQQVLTWRSTGAWQSFESISYQGVVGDESLERSRGDPNAYASAYATFITQVNETPGLSLFVEELSPDLAPNCRITESTVTFQIRDDTRDEEIRWTRCGNAPLSFLDPLGAGPDPAASRVIQAAVLARDFTLGEGFESAYQGSVPFATLDRGEDTPADLTGPLAFLGIPGPGSRIDGPSDWLYFWNEHQAGSPVPEVDWSTEMVLVGAVGLRFEAGDSVEVRRILQVGSGTVVELFERIPGDFCAPASRTQTPFHIVLAPRPTPSVRFVEPRVERVPCGT